ASARGVVGDGPEVITRVPGPASFASARSDSFPNLALRPGGVRLRVRSGAPDGAVRGELSVVARGA
ncbi:MAG: hypothetical protein ACXV9P_06440, partial [Acidimicrobiia bacterium]